MVSVIIPTYNRANLLRICLESVICQTFSDMEIIVVDDGSSDDTKEIVSKFGDERLVYINEGKTGNIPKLFNIGYRASKGEFIAISGDDDVWKAEKLVEQLKHTNDYQFICSDADVIDGKGDVLRNSFLCLKSDSIITTEKLLIRNSIVASTVLIKKSILPSYYMFDEHSLAEDYELWLRLSQKYKLLCLNKVLISFRSHKDNLTSNPYHKIKMYLYCIGLLKKYEKTSDKSQKLFAKRGILGFRILLFKTYLSGRKYIFLFIELLLIMINLLNFRLFKMYFSQRFFKHLYL